MKKLSVIVPTYNEAQTLPTVIRNLLALSLPGWATEIIVVDDGSTDATEEALAPFRQSIIYTRHATNRGKGAAIRTAQTLVTGDALLIHDADLEYHPTDIPALLAALKDERTSAVYGVRPLALAGSRTPHYVLGVRALSWLVNRRFGTRLSDIYTGYKLIRTDAVRPLHLTSEGFEYEMEVTVKLLRANHYIAEVPIRYTPRSFTEGKKIRARDGLVGILTLIRHYF